MHASTTASNTASNTACDEDEVGGVVFGETTTMLCSLGPIIHSHLNPPNVVLRIETRPR